MHVYIIPRTETKDSSYLFGKRGSKNGRENILNSHVNKSKERQFYPCKLDLFLIKQVFKMLGLFHIYYIDISQISHVIYQKKAE